MFQDPKDYLTHYERMLEFLSDESSLPIMQEELGLRGVRCINFYDVVIDFVLLDAFEEVEKPPSSIKAILQNRWISASFRETVSLSNCNVTMFEFFSYIFPNSLKNLIKKKSITDFLSNFS